MYQTLLSHKIRITPREYEVLCLWLVGETAKESSKWLKVSKKTIDYHRQNVRNKFQAVTFSDLKNYIRKIGLADDCYMEAKNLLNTLNK